MPNGAGKPVTNDNKQQYLNCLAQYRLATCVKDEVEAFMKGLNLLVPDTLLSIFDDNELEVRTHYFSNFCYENKKTKRP